ncbi:MAG TPA: sensor histidine kinase N-terminal domain-containing protein [Rhodanobacteraceae bacterium]|jgi:two-component system sensor histidine kinase TctE|nr:sensor histidine kinase N-terminal domain-containing protein [Rhodanobacteraceae bacterium]
MATRSRSLKRRLLLLVGLPLCAVLVCGAALTYGLALYYADRVYDRWLLDSARALGQLVNSDAGRNELTDQARILLQYDPYDRVVYAVRSMRYGLLSGDADLPQPHATQPRPDPVYTSFEIGGHSMRMVSVLIPNDHAAHDTLVISAAETVRKRHLLARELLTATVPIEFALILLAMGLVWLGVNRGLRVLDPLARELRLRHAGDLSPLRTADVPLEVQPLVATIDALLGRVDRMLAQQQRFIADAAHQLRTPLAGLRLQAERALADPRPESVREALAHVERLSAGTARAAGQLLALARAQAPDEVVGAIAPLDLAVLVRDEVAARVPAALAQHADLGYSGATQGVRVVGDALLLRELLGNLIDNALRYGRRDGVVTVSLESGDDAGVVLAVSDNGAGVPEQLWPRLGERFFRVDGNRRDGSGLGLAIVREIAERHGATVEFGAGLNGRGLRVEVRFPPAV